ncbi:MAG: hypothetical protein AAFQ01_02960 [Bacteroidota bacterium]
MGKRITSEECFAKYGVWELPADPKERIAITQPWKNATGPRTVEGKLMVSRNRLVHGLRSRNVFLSHIARLALEEQLEEQFKNEIRPLLPQIEAKISGFAGICQKLGFEEAS